MKFQFRITTIKKNLITSSNNRGPRKKLMAHANYFAVHKKQKKNSQTCTHVFLKLTHHISTGVLMKKKKEGNRSLSLTKQELFCYNRTLAFIL